MPDFLAIILLVILLTMLFIAILVILFESGKGVRKYCENRSISAGWISTEPPGILDCQVDGVRARDRFSKETKKLFERIECLSKIAEKHEHILKELDKQSKNIDSKSKQQKANKIAKNLNNTAIYIQKRVNLFHDLVRDIIRNYDVMTKTWDVNDLETQENAQKIMFGFEHFSKAAESAVNALDSYKNAINIYIALNLTRNIRENGKRLVAALDDLIDVFEDFQNKCNNLNDQLQSKYTNLGLSNSENKSTS